MHIYKRLKNVRYRAENQCIYVISMKYSTENFAFTYADQRIYPCKLHVYKYIALDIRYLIGFPQVNVCHKR